MRRAYWMAGPILLALAHTASAQFPPPIFLPGLPGFVPGFYSFGFPYLPVRPTVIIVMTRPILPREPVPETRRKDDFPLHPDDRLFIRPRARRGDTLPRRPQPMVS